MLEVIGTVVGGIIASLLTAIFYDNLKTLFKKIKRFFSLGPSLDEPGKEQQQE